MISQLVGIFSSVVYVSALIFFFVIVVLHLVSKLFWRHKPLNLNPQSVVIITGGCMGIGKLMAIQIAQKYNCTLIIVDKRKDLFEDVSEEIKKNLGFCECYYCDLADNKSIENFIQSIKATHKKIDLFLYNAGIFIPSKGWEVDEYYHNLIMKVNYFTPVKMINQLFPILQGNHIAIVASMVSVMNGSKNFSAYLASKHAIYGFVHCLRQDLIAAKNPTTISIGCPYAINTTMFKGIRTKLEWIFPTLDENYVAKRLVRQFISKKEVCYIQRRHVIAINILRCLPTYVVDWMQVYLDVSRFSSQKKQQ